MKLLLIVNLVVAGLLIACFGTFAFFTHGVFVNPVGLIIGGICGWFVLMPLLLSVAILFLVNIYGVFRFWSEHEWKTLLPFLVIGVALFGLRIWDVRAMSIRRFEKYLPDYEAYVAIAEKGHKHGDWDRVALPKKYRHLGYLAVVYDDEPNTLFVTFDVGNFGVFGHTAFLYSSNGDIVRGSRASQSWPDRQRVNEHWFRVSD